MHEVSRFAHKEHPVIEFDDKPMGIWVCTETYEVHRDILQPKLKRYLDESRIVQKKERDGVWAWIKYRANDDSISTITFKSYDQGRARFQGAGKQLISFDEEPPRDIWEECTVREEGARRLVDGKWIEDDTSNLRIIMSMTPVNGMTWVYDEIYLATDNPDLKVVLASWQDNPWLSEQQRERMARGLTPEALQVRREGKFVRMTGLVCSWFDRGIHLRHITVDPQWTFYRVLDPGWSKMCCIWIGVDYDDNWYIYDGIYKGAMTEPQLHEAIVRKDAQRYISNAWADSAAASTIALLDQLGTHFTPVEKTPGDGSNDWDEYRARLLEEQGKVARNGSPKIIISPTLMHFDEKKGKEVNWAVTELETVRWAEKKVDGVIQPKARWGDQAKHFIDCLSYFAHEYRRTHGFPDKPNNPYSGNNPRISSDVPAEFVPVNPVGSLDTFGRDPYDI